MTTFKEAENHRQSEFKRGSGYFSEDALLPASTFPL